MAHNVPAVTDSFLFAMRKLRSSFSQTKNCGGTKTHKGRSPTVFLCSPSRRKAAKQLQTCYAKLWRTLLYTYFLYVSNIKTCPIVPSSYFVSGSFVINSYLPFVYSFINFVQNIFEISFFG
jgi:hypothetical protein